MTIHNETGRPADRTSRSDEQPGTPIAHRMTQPIGNFVVEDEVEWYRIRHGGQGELTEARKEVDGEERLVAGEGLGFEVAAGVEPGNRPVGEVGASKAWVGPLGAIETSLLVTKPLLGVDLAVEGLVASAGASDRKASFPAAVVGLDNPPCHGDLLSARPVPDRTIRTRRRLSRDNPTCRVRHVGFPVGFH